jgi:hypothetical protein
MSKIGASERTNWSLSHEEDVCLLSFIQALNAAMSTIKTKAHVYDRMALLWFRCYRKAWRCRFRQYRVGALRRLKKANTTVPTNMVAEMAHNSIGHLRFDDVKDETNR